MLIRANERLELRSSVLIDWQRPHYGAINSRSAWARLRSTNSRHLSAVSCRDHRSSGTSPETATLNPARAAAIWGFERGDVLALPARR